MRLIKCEWSESGQSYRTGCAVVLNKEPSDVAQYKGIFLIPSLHFLVSVFLSALSHFCKWCVFGAGDCCQHDEYLSYLCLISSSAVWIVDTITTQWRNENNVLRCGCAEQIACVFLCLHDLLVKRLIVWRCSCLCCSGRFGMSCLCVVQSHWAAVQSSAALQDGPRNAALDARVPPTAGIVTQTTPLLEMSWMMRTSSGGFAADIKRSEFIIVQWCSEHTLVLFLQWIPSHC